MLEGLKSLAMRPLGWGRLAEQVLGDSDGEPEGEDPLATGPAAGDREDAEQCGGRRVPIAHATLRHKAAYTISGSTNVRQWW
jgi:hypothetical protein